MTSSATVDPDGRRVVLDAAGRRHIVDEHGELAPHREAVLATVAGPDHRNRDARPGRERYGEAAADGEQTPEGLALRFDAAGKITGLTIVGAKRLLEQDGELIVTLPEQVHVAPAAIEAAFATAA